MQGPSPPHRAFPIARASTDIGIEGSLEYDENGRSAERPTLAPGTSLEIHWSGVRTARGAPGAVDSISIQWRRGAEGSAAAARRWGAAAFEAGPPEFESNSI